jgi:hypothetical protein
MSMDSQSTTPSTRQNDAFGWYYCIQAPGHVIALCSGHKYLAGIGWGQGQGILGPLGEATGCCVCMGTATIKRMRGAPLRQDVATRKSQQEGE